MDKIKLEYLIEQLVSNNKNSKIAADLLSNNLPGFPIVEYPFDSNVEIDLDPEIFMKDNNMDSFEIVDLYRLFLAKFEQFNTLESNARDKLDALYSKIAQQNEYHELHGKFVDELVENMNLKIDALHGELDQLLDMDFYNRCIDANLILKELLKNNISNEFTDIAKEYCKVSKQVEILKKDLERIN